MYCQNCGKEVTGNFCPNCGKEVNSSPAPTSSTPESKTKDKTKLFKIFSIISSAFCVLSLIVYFVSSFSKDISHTHISALMIGFCLFPVMSVLLAVNIQPAKQWLSALFYALSCGGLLFIGFLGFTYSLAVLGICWLSVILVIITAVFGRTAKAGQLNTKKIIIIAAVLVALSVVISAGEQISNTKRNKRLSDISINGVKLSQEQLDVIDEEYILRRSMHKELTVDRLEDLGFEKSDRQSVIMPGTEYGTSDYSKVNEQTYLQIEYSSLSFSNGYATTYSIAYKPVKLDDENLRKTVEIYTALTGNNFTLDGSEYSFDDIVAAPVLEEDDAYYWNNSAIGSDVNLSINIRVNKNGYATLDVTYIFPEAVDEMN